MTEEVQHRGKRSKLWIPALALTIIVALLVIPPLVGINGYRSRIARALSNSVGRPVRISSVELRLFPRPGFVITDLTVDEDPQYGAEPVLHASKVTTAIRLASLWAGRLEISRISVDEASLNLVHTASGQWNLDTLFRTATKSQTESGGRDRRTPLPYLEATNSRINIKKGVEKLPYSLVNADLAFWQEEPGDWRVRLKGQPARTDVNLDLGDTGILRLEGRMRRAPEMRQMPIHIEMEWSDAQLGQLSRLLIGSDPGWRGDMTAEMKLDGTAADAQVTTRLRASGVHRAEFAPATPLDFDANCGFIYHYSASTAENLVCESRLGDGRLRVKGDLLGNGHPKLSVELQKIPAQAVLDSLRTVRRQLGAGLEADGTLTGKLSYDASIQLPPQPERGSKPSHGKKAASKQATMPEGPLTGSISLDALRLSGGALNQPVQIQKVLFEPSIEPDGKSEELTGIAEVAAGAPTPVVFTVQLALSGYHISARGAAAPARLRQIARAAGLKEAGALEAIAGDPVTMDLAIGGPWIPAPEVLLAESEGGDTATLQEPVPENQDQPVPDRITGTVLLHNITWKPEMLPKAVQISQATLHLQGGQSVWDPASFVYGPLKGTARLVVPVCGAEEQCLPTLDLDFPTLDAGELQSALLGADNKSTLFSTVLAHLTPSSEHKWPAFQGTLKASSFALGPVMLHDFAAQLRVSADSAELTAVDAGILGGQLHATGKVNNGDKPAYALEGTFEKVSPPALCQVLELKCSGTSVDGDGKIDLSGFAGKDLATSAKGTLHFDWKKGAIIGRSGTAEQMPPVLARFDYWSGTAEIANGSVTLKDNQVQTGKRAAAVNASVTFGEPPKVGFSAAKATPAIKQ